MNIKKIRLTNLRTLVHEFGTISEVAAAAGTSEKYLSQLLNEYPLPSGNPRTIGDNLAQRLESGCGKPTGWMDTRHGEIPREPAEPKISPQERELLRLFRQAKDPIRKIILAVARLAKS